MNRYKRVISCLHGEWGAISQEAYDPPPFLNKCIGMSRDLNKYLQMRNLLKGKLRLMCLFVSVIMWQEWQMESSPVLQWEACQLRAIVQPFELQWPAALCHAGQNQTVSLEVHLGCHGLHFEVGWNIICMKKNTLVFIIWQTNQIIKSNETCIQEYYK